MLLASAMGCSRAESAGGDAAAVTAAPAAELPSEQQLAAPVEETTQVRMPGPGRARLLEAVRLDRGCVGCHEKEAAEWRGSRHHHADTNAAYRAAFALEPSAFCRSCHAPESDPRKEPPRAVSELGVGCVTCHVTEDGIVLAAPRDGDTTAAPHPVRPSSDFAMTGGCAGCHEFPFPGKASDDDRHLMQTTVREHRRSPAADRSCASCHMPPVAGGRSHAFAEVRDPRWLRQALLATAERTQDGVRVTLVQQEPGHGFPTGDLFRRLEIGGELRADDGTVARREVRHLARHFQLLPGQSGRVLVRDDRVFDEPVVVELPLPRPASEGSEVRWWVSYQRVAVVGEGKSPAEAKIESEVLLHSGDLP
jgi:hypothetical protein